jgi:protein-tyrosine-phosphatase
MLAGREPGYYRFIEKVAKMPNSNAENQPLKRVLFVCVENSCRSQIAEAFAHIHGAGVVEAYSSGSRPSGVVNATAIETMRELGYDLSRHRSKSLADIPDLEYDYAITMGCGDECPMVRARHREDWNIPDPKLMPPSQFRAVRDLIESKVKGLLAKLS